MKEKPEKRLKEVSADEKG